MDGNEASRILDQYFPRKKRFVGGNYSTKNYNIIGFGSESITEYKHCPLDPGTRLIKIKGELRCPKCGYVFREEEAPNEEGVTIKHKQHRTEIISGKRNKKHYDKSGNLINDPDMIQEIQRGNTFISYHEYKTE
jgi:rubredoxin